MFEPTSDSLCPSHSLGIDMLLSYAMLQDGQIKLILMYKKKFEKINYFSNLQEKIKNNTYGKMSDIGL